MKIMHKNRGQATLIILLVMGLAATIGLVMSRNVITDIQISKTQEESVRAFSAAEAGIEQSLYSWEAGTSTINLETGSAEVTKENLGEGKTSFVFPGRVDSGDFGVVWLTDHNSDGTIDEDSPEAYSGSSLDICWESDGALELVLVYNGDGGADDYRIHRWAVDPAGRSNNFDSSVGLGCAGLEHSKTLDFTRADSFTTPLFLVVKPFYEDVKLGARAETGATFNSQGKIATSVGTVDKEDEQVSRRLRVFQSWDTPPMIFLEPLFVSGSVQVAD